MGADVGSKARKGSTPGAARTHRPAAPKRAHTSAVSVATIASPAKRNATALTINPDRKIKTPLLTPQLQRAQQTTAAPRTPSPNYFGLVVAEDAGSYGIDSDAGKHAKQNWVLDERELPLEDDPRLEGFRQQSDSKKSFRLEHTLPRFSTDGRVPTLRSLHDANRSDSSPDRQPLSAGGRLTGHVESSEDDDMDLDLDLDSSEQQSGTSANLNADVPSFFDMQISSSPAPDARPSLRHLVSNAESLPAPGGTPHSRVTTPGGVLVAKTRSETLPTRIDADTPTFLGVPELGDLLSSQTNPNIILLDLRVSPQYAAAHIKGALNLCIPTTLLKRPAFNVKKLADTFTLPQEKIKFSHWESASHIIVYDAASIQMKDAQSCINTLKKFRTEGYRGNICIVRGGFNTVSRTRPDLVEKVGGRAGAGPRGMNLSIAAKGNGEPPGGPGIQVAGGCIMPSTGDQPANPFFGNIRQNMDLVDGVGQMAIKRPASLTNNNLRGLPTWLCDVVDEEDEGKAVSERFLKIEQDEQRRMQHALSTKVNYGTPLPRERVTADAKQGKVQISGIEKGTKNRYKDMLPFDHTRVRLQRTNTDGCDYINASHIGPQWSHRKYICAQAPIPATFGDFWKSIWEQDVRVVVMLTAEFENGQRKCHPYWIPETYGDFKVKQLSEKRVNIELPSQPSLLDPSRKASMPLSQLHNQRSFNRRATLAQLNPEDTERPTMPGSEKEPPFCVIRKLALSNVQSPFEPLREIVQVVYTSWPDFGAPAEPSELLGLVAEMNRVVRGSNGGGKGRKSENMTASTTRLADEEASKLPVANDERPILVHCSAGCGRTGTFVTVDTVCDMLRRQRMVAMSRRQQNRNQPSNVRVPVPDSNRRQAEVNRFDLSPTAAKGQGSSQMDIDDEGAASGTSDEEDDSDRDLDDQSWVARDDIDLVEKTVMELRQQRISMVQNLRQFTLCYESVLEWLVREMPERFRRDNFRKSYQG